MIKKILTTTIVLLAITLTSFAQDINGKWKGKVMDQFEVVYDFKVDAEKLTGSTTGPDGNIILIKDGKVKDNDISFIINIMDQELKVEGKMEGDKLTLKMNMMGNDVAIILIKEK